MSVIFHIKSSTGRYGFVQDARCKHCKAFFYKPGNDNRTFSLAWCAQCSKAVGPGNFACDKFVCNSKYVLVNRYVQLNLFENAK